MEKVTNEIGNSAKKHEERLLHHVNVENDPAARQQRNSAKALKKKKEGKKNLLSWCSDH